MTMRAALVLSSAALLASCASVAGLPSNTPTRQEAAKVDHHPGGMAYVSYALGKVDVETGPDNAKQDDDTKAGMARAFIDAGGEHFGGGLHVDWMFGDDDLFGSTQITSLDVMPFFTFRPTGGDKFRIPIRVGPHFQVHHGEDDSAGAGFTEIDFASVGGAVEVEPEFDFFRNRDQALSIYGNVRGGWGVAKVQVTSGGQDTDYDTTSTTLGFETGVRYQISKFLLTGGWLLRATKFDQTDPNNDANAPATTIDETDIGFGGFFVGGGVRW